MSSEPKIIDIKPKATDAERAAIVAACKLLWPGIATNVIIPAPSPRWRYAGRHWHKRPKYSGWR